MNAAESSPNGVSEMFCQAARFFQTALEAGIKIQEESAHAMTNMIDGFASPRQWQERAEAAMAKTFELGQKNVEQAIEIMNDNTKQGLELLERAFSARQAQSAEEVNTKVHETWETALGSLRRNSELMVQATGRMVESWNAMANLFRAGPVDAPKDGPSS